MRTCLLWVPFIVVLLFAGCVTQPREAVQANYRSASFDLIEEGDGLEDQGLYEQAIQRYLKASELAPTPQIDYRIGRSFSRLGEHVTAVAYLERALKAQPRFEDAEYELGHAKNLAAVGNPGVREEFPPLVFGGAPPVPVAVVSNAPLAPRPLALSTEDFQPRRMKPATPGSSAKSVRTHVVPSIEGSVPVEPIRLAGVSGLSTPPVGFPVSPRPIRPAVEESDRHAHLIDRHVPPVGVSLSAEREETEEVEDEVTPSGIHAALFKGKENGLATLPPLNTDTMTYLQDAQFFIKKGDELMAGNEPRKAVSEYIEALRLNERAVAARIGLGEAYRALGETGNAEAQFKRAASMETDNALAASSLANLYFKEGRYNEALAEGERAVRLDGEDFDAVLLLGDICAKIERQSRAEMWYRHASALLPESPRPHWKLGNLRMNVKDFEQARSSYETALGLDSGFVPAINNLGVLAQLQLDMEESEARFKEALGVDPTWAKAYWNLAILYEGAEMDRPKDAIKQYREYIELGGPRSAEAKSAIAQIQTRL